MEDVKKQVDLSCGAFLSLLLQIYGEVLHPLHHEEAERPAEAQDDHQQQLPHQHQVAAVEERRGCTHRLTQQDSYFYGKKCIIGKILKSRQHRGYCCLFTAPWWRLQPE